MLLGGLLLLPVHVRGQALWAGRLEGTVSVQVGPLRLPVYPREKKRKPASSAKHASGKRRRSAMLAVLRKNTGLRRFLFRSIHPELLRIRALIATEDAARTALLSGAVTGVLALLPLLWREHTEVRVMPDFFSARTRAQGQCIIHARLGMLLTGAAWLALASWREQRGRKPRR